MSEDKHFENDPERTLITLEQLSQTIEVMTSVVNRLRQHLSEQLHAQMEEQNEKLDQLESPDAEDNIAQAESSAGLESEATEAADATPAETTAAKKESFVVEIRQQDNDLARKNGKILH